MCPRPQYTDFIQMKGAGTCEDNCRQSYLELAYKPTNLIWCESNVSCAQVSIIITMTLTTLLF